VTRSDEGRQAGGPSLRLRLRFAFDNTLSRGPAALIVWLALATGVMIVLAVGLILAVGGTPKGSGLRDVLWNVAFQALVPNPPGDISTPWQYLVVMLLVTVASLAMVSILIGLLSATIQSRVETLRRGRIPIIASGHTVILGWSDQVFDIVSGLVAANKHHRKSVIAILGEADKVEMEEEIRRRVTSMGSTRVVCRRGSPTQHADLDLVSPQTSRSIIILPGDDVLMPDAATLKTILALTGAPNRRPEPYYIVGVLRRERNLEIAKMIGGDEVQMVLSGRAIARVIAQTCRQVGLSIVYTEFLDPSGDQIYFREEPALVGLTYAETVSAYEDSAVMGIRPRGGTALLNPPMETILRDGDEVIAISADVDSVRLSGAGEPVVQTDAIDTGPPGRRAPERTLILGWNWRAGTIVRQLDAFVAPGSAITVAAQSDGAESAVEGLSREMQRQRIRFEAAETANRTVLEGLLAEPYEPYDHVVVLSYSDDFDTQRADALTLLTLMHLRAIADTHSYGFSLVSEMMDVRNRDLAGRARADDFIVSDRLISLILTQVSENRAMVAVLQDLVDPAGAEIYLKPAGEYVKSGVPVSFYTVVEAARRRGETAIGYRLQALVDDASRAFGVVVNPRKSEPVTFSKGDRVIVVAEDQ
jgi:voltage-gated potassium channel Kch